MLNKNYFLSILIKIKNLSSENLEYLDKSINKIPIKAKTNDMMKPSAPN